jgi:hypothetical protein
VAAVASLLTCAATGADIGWTSLALLPVAMARTLLGEITGAITSCGGSEADDSVSWEAESCGSGRSCVFLAEGGVGVAVVTAVEAIVGWSVVVPTGTTAPKSEVVDFSAAVLCVWPKSWNGTMSS